MKCKPFQANAFCQLCMKNKRDSKYYEKINKIRSILLLAIDEELTIEDKQKVEFMVSFQSSTSSSEKKKYFSVSLNNNLITIFEFNKVKLNSKPLIDAKTKTSQKFTSTSIEMETKNDMTINSRNNFIDMQALMSRKELISRGLDYLHKLVLQFKKTSYEFNKISKKVRLQKNS